MIKTKQKIPTNNNNNNRVSEIEQELPAFHEYIPSLTFVLIQQNPCLHRMGNLGKPSPTFLLSACYFCHF